MTGPHLPWSDRPHSPARLARIRECCTLEDVHDRTVALGQPISVAHLHRMETEGDGSPEAWLILARVLRVDLASIRPAPTPAERDALDTAQLVIPGTSSS